MKKVLVLFFYTISFYLNSQNNLVQNGGFETHVGTLDCERVPSASSPDIVTHDQQRIEEYWNQCPPWQIPQKKSSPCYEGAASSDHLCPGGNFGPTYGFMIHREYITQELASPLIPHKWYYIEFYIRNGSGTGSLENAGICFSTDRPKQCSYRKLNIDVNNDPNIEIDNNLIFSDNAWTKVSIYYLASLNYSWITIGTFNKDEGFSQSFRIDDIKIIEWFPPCPTVQLIENYDFTGLYGNILAGNNNLYAGYDVGASTPNGNVTIHAGSNIGFKAWHEVGLFDGFLAETGSEFHAYNAPCNSDCFPPSPAAGISADICDGLPYELGESAGFNQTYTWTSTPSNAISYLSSTTISNPVFTPPPNGSGTITYTVTAINSCGQTGVSSVTVHYEENPSSTVQLSLSNVTLGDIPTFDVNYDSHVKSVTIEVLDGSLTNVFYTENFYDVIDFSCCSFPWELPVSLSPCMDYKIRVTARNYCTGATSSQIIDWTRNRSVTLTALLPNVVTPNGDGVNDQFCFQFTGASSYTLIVNAPSGVPVFVASNVVAYPVSVCSWAGECNVGFPTCSGDHVGDGVYFFTLTLYGCDGQEAFSTAGYLELLNGGGRLANPGDSMALEGNPNGANSISVFPNPTSDGNVTVDFGNQSSRKLEVYNAVGQMLQVQAKEATDKNQIVLQGLSAGIYYLRIYLDSGGCEVRQVVVL
jgi:hypothetical protein